MRGWPVDLYDVAGVRASDDAIETAGVEAALELAADADWIVVVSDLSVPESETETTLRQQFPRHLWLGNKADCPIHPTRSQLPDLQVSALEGNKQRILSLRVNVKSDCHKSDSVPRVR